MLHKILKKNFRISHIEINENNKIKIDYKIIKVTIHDLFFLNKIIIYLKSFNSLNIIFNTIKNLQTQIIT